MKRINQYAPFILWSTATIILTVIAFIALPVILVYKKIEGLFSRRSLKNIPVYEESEDADSHGTNYRKSLIA
jgi:hypothetical protein